MLRLITSLVVCLCTFVETVRSDDSSGSLDIRLAIPGFVQIHYQSYTVSPSDRSRVLPPEFQPCGTVVKEGRIFEVFTRECGVMPEDGWIREQDVDDAWFLPFKPVPLPDALLPPVASPGDDREIRPEPISGSIEFDPLLDHVEISLAVDPEFVYDHLVLPDRGAGVAVTLLEGIDSTPERVRLVIRGSSPDVVRHLVRTQNVVAGTFTTLNNDITYRLVRDLENVNTWYVLMGDTLVIRTYVLPAVGGSP